MRRIAIALLAGFFLGACTQAPVRHSVGICDDRGCSERPRDSETFVPSDGQDDAARRKLAALEALAVREPGAAHDLGLRYFRGDGVAQDSYSGLKWMRHAAERGDLAAQMAVGRLYLTGLEEMGADPREAERWLAITAGRGDREAAELLAEARAARRSEQDYHRWSGHWRAIFLGYWTRGYPYRAYWRHGGWYIP